MPLMNIPRQLNRSEEDVTWLDDVCHLHHGTVVQHHGIGALFWTENDH